MTSLSLVVGEKTMKSGYILNNFCVYVQNHIFKPIKRQKYNVIALVSTKYFNRSQSILLSKNLGPFKKKRYTIFVDKKKMLTSAKNTPFWLVVIWNKSYHSSYYSYKVSTLQSLSLKAKTGGGLNLLPNVQTPPWKPQAY